MAEGWLASISLFSPLDKGKLCCPCCAASIVAFLLLLRNVMVTAEYTASLVVAEPLCLHLQSPIFIMGDIHGNFHDLHFFLKEVPFCCGGAAKTWVRGVGRSEISPPPLPLLLFYSLQTATQAVDRRRLLVIAQLMASD